MGDAEDQENVFNFLCERLDTQQSFTREELTAVTSWKGKTTGTYWSKQFRPFVVETGSSTYRVSEAFRPFATWERFRQHVTQVRRITANDYKYSTYDNVLVYEFFMPLTNEAALRGTLDALFYKDTMLAKLRAQDPGYLHGQMPKSDDESEDVYHERVCEWLSRMFVGYSISHVAGRFRARDLATRKEVVEIEKRTRYLVDETTAIARFIFPCKENEVDRVRWFFEALFVKAVIEVVNGEDEIWMVESGMRNCLHIWRVEQAE